MREQNGPREGPCDYLSLESWTEQRRTGLPPSAAGPRALCLSPRGTTTHGCVHGITVYPAGPRPALSLSLSLSLFRHPPPLSGPPPPPPHYARWRGLRRSFHRRRALTRYSHPFCSLPACETEHPNPNLKAIWLFPLIDDTY